MADGRAMKQANGAPFYALKRLKSVNLEKTGRETGYSGTAKITKISQVKPQRCRRERFCATDVRLAGTAERTRALSAFKETPPPTGSNVQIKTAVDLTVIKGFLPKRFNHSHAR